MSTALPEGQAPVPAQPTQQPDPSAVVPSIGNDPNDQSSTPYQGPQATGAMARYTIHVPLYDNDKKEIPYVLGAARKAMTQAGFDGRIVMSPVQGDWKDYDTDEMALVMTDAPDTPQIVQTLMTIAQGIKALTAQAAVYITKQPIETYLI
jgi:hypothetical protein